MDHIEARRSRRSFVLRLAARYLEADMYFYFCENYLSNKITDNRKVKKIEDYIWRRYKYGKSQRDLERDKRELRRRRQINERSVD